MRGYGTLLAGLPVPVFLKYDADLILSYCHRKIKLNFYVFWVNIEIHIPIFSFWIWSRVQIWSTRPRSATLGGNLVFFRVPKLIHRYRTGISL